MKNHPPLPRRARAVFAVLAGGLLLLAPGTRSAAALPATYSSIPTQAPAPSGSQADFSEYAWQLFVALNWPALPGVRGVPNPQAPLGSPGPTVWQTFKTTEQTFLDGAQDPGPWNSGPIVLPSLRYRSKAPAGLPLPPSIAQAVGGWLIDQQGQPTYYEIAVGQVSYEYIRANRYYNADVLNQATTISFPTGAIEIKAAWRILPAASNRFLTLQTQVMQFDAQGNPTYTYKPALVGLVGLHIVYKPAGFPQWVWATFEQLDNAPLDAGAAQSGANWSYYNPACSGSYCTPNIAPQTSGQPYGSPNQITRLSPIRPATATSNQKWQQLLQGTVFANYQLISPQWPTDPNDPGNPQGSPAPSTVANVTMESYVQPTSSCMDCHSTARTPNNNTTTNYSFTFLFAQSPSSKSSQP